MLCLPGTERQLPKTAPRNSVRPPQEVPTADPIRLLIVTSPSQANGTHGITGEDEISLEPVTGLPPWALGTKDLRPFPTTGPPHYSPDV